MKIRTLLLLSLLFICTLTAVAHSYTVDEIPNVQLADSTRFLSNPDGIVDPTTEQRINEALLDIRRRTTAEAVAVIVDDIEGDDYDSFATELFEKWGLGQTDKDNGLLILVVKNLRKAVIRPGYGLEGVLPDIVCGGILRNNMFPYFKEEKYGAGLLNGVESIRTVLTDPQAAEEIRSSLSTRNGTEEDDNFFAIYFGIAAIITLLMLGMLFFTWQRNHRSTNYGQYKAYSSLKPMFLALTFIGAGLPLIASGLLMWKLHRLRNKPRKCPNCGATMQKMDEEHDNDYLNSAQDLEERIGSVDYDVWRCPSCGETDIEQFVQSSPFTVCEHCHARACRLDRKRIIQQPTHTHGGRGIEEHRCINCGHIKNVAYTIPMLATPIILPGGGRGNGFGGGGGGFGGGGFGGGHTGGGGASGGW